MVAYVKDRTGRFAQRPHYKLEELDRECETIISGFLKDIHGDVGYPVDTDDLTKLIERDAEDLDLYADLSCYGEDVEGVTLFRKGRKPTVFISEKLSNDDRRKNRFRTTLTHEYGHVRFHAYLWEFFSPTPDMLRQSPNSDKVICKRDSILDAAQTDWMEWQAGYACGAFLMPKSAVLRLCQEYVEAEGIYGQVSLLTPHAANLIAQTARAFEVSEDAARVRLIKLCLLTEGPTTISLFD